MTVGLALRYHYRWLVVTLLLCLVVAAGVAQSRPPSYQATALVQVDATGAGSQGPSATAAPPTRASDLIPMVLSRAFLAQVCARPELRGSGCNAGTLQKEVSADLISGTALVGVTVADGRPGDAATLANQVADQLVTTHAARAAQFYATPIAQRNSQLHALSTQIAGQESDISAVESNPALTDAGKGQAAAPYFSQLDVLQSAYAADYSDLQTLQMNQLSDEKAVTVLQPAQAPVLPSQPGLFGYLGVGAAVGLVLGFLLMLLAARFDGRIRESRKLAQVGGIPFVFEMPPGGSVEQTMESCGAAVAALLSHRPGTRSVLLVAADDGTDIPGCVGPLASVLHGLGRNVRAVVETGLESRPEAESTDQAALDTITPVAALSAITEAGDPHKTTLRNDLVLFGAGRPDRSPLAMVVARHVDQVVVVASQGRTPASAVQRCTELLRHAGAGVAAGILLSDAGRFTVPAAHQVVVRSA